MEQALLIVDVARLKPEGEQFAGETGPEAIALGAAAGLCTPVGGMSYDLFVERVGQELLARGRVAHAFKCLCSRCAEPFALTVAEESFCASWEITENTTDMDLTPEMREAIILLLPGYPVCRDSCKGLCPRCGANRNQAPCSCRPGPEETWGALDKCWHTE